MAFCAAASLWGLAQGQATVRFFVDSPGLPPSMSRPERAWVEVTLPFLKK